MNSRLTLSSHCHHKTRKVPPIDSHESRFLHAVDIYIFTSEIFAFQPLKIEISLIHRYVVDIYQLCKVEGEIFYVLQYSCPWAVNLPISVCIYKHEPEGLTGQEL